MLTPPDPVADIGPEEQPPREAQPDHSSAKGFAMRNAFRKFNGTAHRFLRDGRGGATMIAAVCVTFMALGGAALIIDHDRLVAQRDIVKSAADAASLAATLELNRLPDTLSEDEMRDRVLAVAEKYGILNVLGNTADPNLTADEVDVAFDIDYGLRIVSTSVEADTGSTLVSSWLYSYLGPGSILARSGVEIVETTVELVIAIDLSGSMNRNLDGDTVLPDAPNSRLSIVRNAARELVDILQPEGVSNVAVGILPWDLTVRLSPDARTAWADNGWVEYPDSRHYPFTHSCRPQSSCTDTTRDDDLPDVSPVVWQGCLDEDRVTTGHAELGSETEWFDPPADRAFAQAIFPARWARTYDCLRSPAPPTLRQHSCYGPNVDGLSRVTADEPAQQRCNQRRRCFRSRPFGQR